MRAGPEPLGAGCFPALGVHPLLLPIHGRRRREALGPAVGAGVAASLRAGARAALVPRWRV